MIYKFVVYAACGPDEYLPPCIPCGTKNCGDEVAPFCTMDCKFTDQCYCVEGKVRNKEGKCVNKEECPK